MGRQKSNQEILCRVIKFTLEDSEESTFEIARRLEIPEEKVMEILQEMKR